jgi:hypothetical protein
MALQGLITQNSPGNTQQIVFNNPSMIDSITYGNAGITYPNVPSYTLTQSDFSLFYTYKTQFYNALLINFPSLSEMANLEVPVCQMKIYSSSGPNIIQYYQSSTASPTSLVYNISFDRGSLTTTFAARPAAITISIQEYLLAFPIIALYANQVGIA